MFKETGWKTPAFIHFMLKSKLMLVILSSVMILGLVRVILKAVEYPLLMYLCGLAISFYPIILGVVYWRRHKTE